MYKFVLAVIFSLSISDQSSAQDACLGALIQDKGFLDMREVSSIALVESYRSSSNRNSNWDVGITVPIKGVPIKVDGKGGKSALETYMRNLSLNWSTDKTLSYATQVLSSNAVRAYEACVGNLNHVGTSVFASDATPEQITVTFRWNAPVNAPTETKDARLTVTGGKFADGVPSTWKTGAEYAVVVEREKGKDVRIIANIAGSSADKTVYHIPVATVETATFDTKDQLPDKWYRVANQGDGYARELSRCIAPRDGWSFVPDSARINIHVRVGKIDRRTYAKINESTTNRICFYAYMYPLAKEGGGDLQFSIIYDELKVSIQ